PQAKSESGSEGRSVDRAQQGRSGGGRSREAIPVLVGTATQKTMPLQIRAVGNVEAYSTVSVKSQVTGVVTQAHFKEGENVKKGTVLFHHRPRPFGGGSKAGGANPGARYGEAEDSAQTAPPLCRACKKGIRVEGTIRSDPRQRGCCRGRSSGGPGRG